MGYRRRASPLHAARAAAGSALCGALVLTALLFDDPLVLGAVIAAALAAGALAGVWPQLRRALLFALPFTLAIALLNPLVTEQGVTVIWRFGELPLLGDRDITLEAVVYGLLLGLRALAVIVSFALFSATVDPDQLLRLFRRVSFRSALTATLATRMVPVLQRDGQRIADAQRCRPGPPPSRLTLVRAVTAGALDRAVEVAAALEVRGYGAARRPPRGAAAPWSRHDLAFTGAAAVVVALALGARLAGVASFEVYPRIVASWDAATLLLCAALVVVPLLPFLDRRGIE